METDWMKIVVLFSVWQLASDCCHHKFIYMSRRRNRHRSLSNTSRDSDRSHTPSAKKEIIGRSTTYSMYLSQQREGQPNLELMHKERLFNRNISFFRDNFNPNDPSQLPFMSSLRDQPEPLPQASKTITVCFPFQAALKNTSNQVIKKRISDFDSKQNRLSTAYYRWHNRSGRNNKWAVDFECSLRDYGAGAQTAREKDFYPYVAPIIYKDVEQRHYDSEEMVCTRHNKSFKIR